VTDAVFGCRACLRIRCLSCWGAGFFQTSRGGGLCDPCDILDRIQGGTQVDLYRRRRT